MKRLVILIFIFAFGQQSWSQQSVLFYHPRLNPYLYNPASAGSDEVSRCNLQYQKAMQNMTGSPESFVFTAEHPFSNPKMGMGITFINDRENFISNTSGYVTYRYRLQFESNHRLSGALSAGILHNSIKFENVEAEFPQESNLYELESSQTAPDANISFLYQYKQVNIGFSALNMLNSRFHYYNQNNVNSTTYSIIRQFNVVASYQYSITPSINIESNLLVQSIQGMPLVFNPALYFSCRKKAWVGTSWRPSTGVSFCAGGAIQERYSLTYAYCFPLTHNSSIIGPTHELTLSIRFQTQKAFAGDAVQQKQDFSREEFDHLVAITQKQFDEINKLNNKNSELKDVVDENENTLKEQQNELQRMHQILQKEREEVAKVTEMQKSQAKEQAKTSALTQAIPPVKEKVDSADRVFENTRYHVIIGAYLSLVDAKMFQDVLKKDRGIITRIVPSNEADNFLIYSKGVKDDDDAERGQLHKLSYYKYKLGNIWLYTQKNNNKLNLGAGNLEDQP